LAGVAVLATVGAMVGWGTMGVAHAGVSTFTMTPPNGTPGTVVHVSGTGCTPGLLASAGTDFVTVTATTLDLAFRVPVSANGSWQGSFTVPPSTLGAGALVDAVCVSSSVQSLLTIYSPQNFVVTHDVAPPTVVPGSPDSTVHTPTDGSTAPGATAPRTHPRGGDVSVAPKPTLGGGISTTLPSGGAVPGIAGGSNGDAAGSGASKTDPTVVALGSAHAHAAGAATLQPADLGASLAADHDGTGSLGWLGGLLAIALVLAAFGAGGWLWRSRRRRALVPAEDTV
jgi:hypothetical protein